MNSQELNLFNEKLKWKSFSATKKSSSKPPSKLKFKVRVNDEDGEPMRTSFDSLSSPSTIKSLDDFIDEQCLHFEENFVNLENLDQFENDFLEHFTVDKTKSSSLFKSQESNDTVYENCRKCKKCGHNVLKL